MCRRRRAPLAAHARTQESTSRARAMAMRCFCPPLRRTSRSPTSVAYPSAHRGRPQLTPAEHPSGIIDTRENIDITFTLDTSDTVHLAPFRRVQKVLRKEKNEGHDRPTRPVPLPTSLTPAKPSKSSTLAVPSTSSTPRLSVSSTIYTPPISMTGPATVPARRPLPRATPPQFMSPTPPAPPSLLLQHHEPLHYSAPRSRRVPQRPLHCSFQP